MNFPRNFSRSTGFESFPKIYKNCQSWSKFLVVVFNKYEHVFWNNKQIQSVLNSGGPFIKWISHNIMSTTFYNSFRSLRARLYHHKKWRIGRLKSTKNYNKERTILLPNWWQTWECLYSRRFNRERNFLSHDINSLAFCSRRWSVKKPILKLNSNYPPKSH